MSESTRIRSESVAVTGTWADTPFAPIGNSNAAATMAADAAVVPFKVEYSVDVRARASGPLDAALPRFPLRERFGNHTEGGALDLWAAYVSAVGRPDGTKRGGNFAAHVASAILAGSTGMRWTVPITPHSS
jgi:hypothetical protein